MSSWTRRSAGESGAAAVEFAVVLPVFVALLLGIVDFGWFFFHEVTIANAAREGARTGVTHAPGDAEDGITAAVARAREYLETSGVSCGETCSVVATDVGTSPELLLEVTIQYPYTPLVGFIPTPAQIEARSSMRYEVQF